MSEKTYPYVLWVQRDGEVGRYRLVAVAPGQYEPEVRHEDDSMGQRCWVHETWGTLWWADLAHWLLQRLEGVDDD